VGVWDELSSLPGRTGEYDQSGALTTSWLPDPTSNTGAPLAENFGGVASWLLSDPFANVTAVIGTSGASISGSRTLNAFGATRAGATGTLATSAIGFASQYLEAATGLYDMRARDYDPTSGRFTANDPVAVPTGMPYVAGYSYAYNNPLTGTDTSGNWTDPDNPIVKWIEHKISGVFQSPDPWFKDSLQACGFHRSADGNYSSTSNAPQLNAGYNDFIDVGFRIVTDPGIKKFPFQYGLKSYVVWAWKGDYLNLGAGGGDRVLQP
jgi:RHS repeat-associated protein